MTAPGAVGGGEGDIEAPAARPRRRIRGLDLARAVAIVGMVAVHIGPTDAGGLSGDAYALPHGRSVLLFVLLAGAGVSLLDRGRSAGLTPVRLVWRAVVLLPAGLALQELDHGVAVILQDYALVFVVALVLRPLGDRWLLTVAGATFVLGPVVHVSLEHAYPDVVTGYVTALSDPPWEIIRGLVVTGPYPLLTYVAPFTLGMWLGRRDLADPRVVVWLFLAGAVAAVGVLGLGTALRSLGPLQTSGWWALALDQEPHSQSLVWLASSSGAAVAVLAACVAAAALVPRAVTPFVALGQLALSVYVAHLLVIAAFEDVVRVDDVGGAALRLAGFVVVAASLAWIWRALLRRGPLELALWAPIAPLERRRRARAAASWATHVPRTLDGRGGRP